MWTSLTQVQACALPGAARLVCSMRKFCWENDENFLLKNDRDFMLKHDGVHAKTNGFTLKMMILYLKPGVRRLVGFSSTRTPAPTKPSSRRDLCSLFSAFPLFCSHFNLDMSVFPLCFLSFASFQPRFCLHLLVSYWFSVENGDRRRSKPCKPSVIRRTSSASVSIIIQL